MCGLRRHLEYARLVEADVATVRAEDEVVVENQPCDVGSFGHLLVRL
jgi:hypothetical protein